MKRVIRGQAVSKKKVEQAKLLRKRMTPAERTLWQALRRNQLDGSIHEKQAGHDAERTRIFEYHGFHVLRVTNDDVLGELPALLDQIRSVVGDLQK